MKRITLTPLSEKELEQAQTIKDTQKQPKNIIVKGDNELLKKLESGYSLVQSLEDDKFLMKI